MFRPAAALTCCFWVTAAHADPAAECVEQHFSAQGERANGALLRSLDFLEACAAPHCPAPVKRECGAWLAEVQAELPSVILSVSTEAGADVAPQEVWLDETQVVAKLGSPLPLDPGRHEFRVRTASGARFTQVFVAQSGVKKRLIKLVVPSSEVEAATSERRVTWPVVAWAGLGVAGFVGAGIFGSMARSGESDLEECSPDCSTEAINQVKADYRMANVSLGVGAAGLVTAVLWYTLNRHEKAADSTSAATRTDTTPTHAAPTIDVSPESGGGARFSLGLRGSF